MGNIQSKMFRSLTSQELQIMKAILSHKEYKELWKLSYNYSSKPFYFN